MVQVPTKAQQKLLHHLAYEWQMFCFAYDLLNAIPADCEPIRNVVLESLIVHGRVLIEFFFRNAADTRHFRLKDLDKSLTPGGLKGKPGSKTWWDQASRRVIHLGKERREALSKWNASKVRDELEEEIRKIEKVYGEFQTMWPHSKIQRDAMAGLLNPTDSMVAAKSVESPTGPGASANRGSFGGTGASGQ